MFFTRKRAGNSINLKLSGQELEREQPKFIVFWFNERVTWAVNINNNNNNTHVHIKHNEEVTEILWKPFSISSSIYNPKPLDNSEQYYISAPYNSP